MTRRCGPCDHSARELIDAALLAGGAYRSIAKRFGLSAAATFRHRQHVGAAAALAAARTQPSTAVVEHVATVSAREQTLAETWIGLSDRARAILDGAAKDPRLALQAIAECRALLALPLRFEADLRRSAAVAELPEHRDWPQLCAVLLDALQEHPLALDAVRRALELATRGAA